MLRSKSLLFHKSFAKRCISERRSPRFDLRVERQKHVSATKAVQLVLTAPLSRCLQTCIAFPLEHLLMYIKLSEFSETPPRLLE